MGPGRKHTVLWLLLGALFLYGPAGAAGEETITGRLALFDLEGRLTAALTQDGALGAERLTLKLVNWAQLQLPPGCSSGATVKVTGSRLARGGSSLVPFQGSRVEVVAAPAPLRLQAGARGSGGMSAQADVGRDLQVLVLRPKLPNTCQSDMLMTQAGAGSVAEWKALVRALNNVHSTCTAGQLTYVEAEVPDAYVSIPCRRLYRPTDPDDIGCDFSAFTNWYWDSYSAAPSQLGIEPNYYDHVIVDLPLQSGCRLLGMGNYDSNQLYYHGFIVNDDNYYKGNFLDPDNILTISHEMGHNYGLLHGDALSLGPQGAPPAGWQTSYGTDDDSNVMGYNNLLSCFSYRDLAALDLASPRELGPSDLPPGKPVDIQLRPSWGAAPQGAIFWTGKRGQSDWQIWASYVVTTSSQFAEGTFSDFVYDKSVILHLVSSNIPFTRRDGSQVHRVRVLQSGGVFKWAAAGLVFRFTRTSTNGQTAFLRVCREVPGTLCRLRLITPPASKPVQLVLQAGGGQAGWCLQACTQPDCQLPSPAFPAGLTNVFFSQHCSPARDSSAWRGVAHASGYKHWVNVATGKCLTVTDFTESYEGATNGRNGTLKYRLALAECNTVQKVDFRRNPQLFVERAEGPASARLFTLHSGMLYTKCDDCGSLWQLCVEGCTAASAACSEYLAAPAGGAHNGLAVAANCKLRKGPQSIKLLPIESKSQ